MLEDSLVCDAHYKTSYPSCSSPALLSLFFFLGGCLCIKIDSCLCMQMYMFIGAGIYMQL